MNVELLLNLMQISTELMQTIEAVKANDPTAWQHIEENYKSAVDAWEAVK